MKRLILISLCIWHCAFLTLHAQELRCNVTINSDQIEGSSKEIFNTLQQAINDYVNQQTWTNLTFAESERIECNMMLIVKQLTDDGKFTCEFQVQSRRPVYGTTYTTPLINFRDKLFCFTYQAFDRLEYQQNVFTTNLTAMLAYYCYLIIGYDCDSYQRLGGTPYFQQCEDIVRTAMTASLETSEMEGWKAVRSAGGNRDRYTMINNLMDEAFRPYREFFYTYHRLGLDEMQGNVANSRARIAEGLPVLKETYRARPTTHLVSTFLDAKADELASLFEKGTSDEKKKVYDLLMDLDPTRQNTYEKINN